MKKSLLALAVAAALPGVALAQSSVTLSGNVKLGLASTNFSNGPATAVNGSILGVADGSSRFILSGVEDLGGGLKGIFQIDQRFRGDESPASSQANGNTFVGLAGGFGQFRIGKLDTYYGFGTDEHGIRATALQHSNISILSYVGQGGNPIASASRSLNVLRYDSPKFGGLGFGLTFSPAAQSATGEGTAGVPGTAQKGQAWSADLNYAAGPIRAGLALWDHKNEGYQTIPAGATVTGQKAARIWGGYNFGMFDVGLTVDQSKLLFTGADTKRTAFSVPVKANLGAGTLLFTASVAQNLKTNGNTVANSGARMYVLGYDYALSKRTTLGVSYAFLDNKSAGAYALYTGTALGNIQTPLAGQDTKQLYLGIRHAF
jgi:predicted porin